MRSITVVSNTFEITWTNKTAGTRFGNVILFGMGHNCGVSLRDQRFRGRNKKMHKRKPNSRHRLWGWWTRHRLICTRTKCARFDRSSQVWCNLNYGQQKMGGFKELGWLKTLELLANREPKIFLWFTEGVTGDKEDRRAKTTRTCLWKGA